MDEIIEIAAEIHHISKELEVFYEPLRKAQYLLQENNSRCAMIGYNGAGEQAATLEKVIQEYLYLHQKLSKVFEECSARYLHEVRTALPPTAPIKIDFEF